MLLHEEKKICPHCRELQQRGECCGQVDCACRNVYREAQRGEIRQGIITDYLARKARRR